MGWITEEPGFDFRQGREFTLFHSIHTSSEAHPASYPVGTGCYFSGVKAAGREYGHSFPTGADPVFLVLYFIKEKENSSCFTNKQKR
jgi:hypothetical protein